MITLATPIMTPSSVRKLRSLCERIESIARLNALWKLCQERENPETDCDIYHQDNVI